MGDKGLTGSRGGRRGGGGREPSGQADAVPCPPHGEQVNTQRPSSCPSQGLRAGRRARQAPWTDGHSQTLENNLSHPKHGPSEGDQRGPDTPLRHFTGGRGGSRSTSGQRDFKGRSPGTAPHPRPTARGVSRPTGLSFSLYSFSGCVRSKDYVCVRVRVHTWAGQAPWAERRTNARRAPSCLHSERACEAVTALCRP